MHDYSALEPVAQWLHQQQRLVWNASENSSIKKISYEASKSGFISSLKSQLLLHWEFKPTALIFSSALRF